MMAGCETEVPARFPTATEHPDDERQPDGIAVDLTSEPPPAVIEGETEAGLVTLSTPLGTDVAMQSLRAFFESISTEDISAMMAVVDAGALVHDTSVGTNRPIHSVTSLFRQRFRKHDYHQLASRLVYREGDVTVYRGNQTDLLPLSVRHLHDRRQGAPTDVVFQVPIVTHSLKNQRVLGDELFFWLRQRGERYVIYRIAEDVPL